MNKFSIYFLLLLYSNTLFALEPAVIKALQDGYSRIVNTVIALNSDDYISGGKYKLSEDSVDLEMYHIPLRYNFDPIYKDFNLFANGSLGYGKLTSQEDFFSYTSPDDYKITLKTYKLGFGVRYKPNKDFYFLIGYSLIYSEFKSTYTYNTQSSKDIFGQFDFILNTEQSNWSREFLIATQYEHEVYKFLPYIFGEYKLYNTTTDLKLNETYRTTSQDSIYRIKIGSYSPTIFKIYNNKIKLNTFVMRTYMKGDINKVTNGDGYDTYALGIHLFPKDKDSLVDEIGIISEWTKDNNFNGYNIGLSIKLDL